MSDPQLSNGTTSPNRASGQTHGPIQRAALAALTRRPRRSEGAPPAGYTAWPCVASSLVLRAAGATVALALAAPAVGLAQPPTGLPPSDAALTAPAGVHYQ